MIIRVIVAHDYINTKKNYLPNCPQKDFAKSIIDEQSKHILHFVIININLGPLTQVYLIKVSFGPSFIF